MIEDFADWLIHLSISQFALFLIACFVLVLVICFACSAIYLSRKRHNRFVRRPPYDAARTTPKISRAFMAALRERMR